jgi:hypothetical protein
MKGKNMGNKSFHPQKTEISTNKPKLRVKLIEIFHPDGRQSG